MSETKFNMDKVAAHIDLGRHDDELDAVFNAVRRRMGENFVDFPWTVTLDEVAFGISDMSLMSLEAAEVTAERSWQVLDPESSAVEYKALLICHLSHDLGWSDTRIEQFVLGLTMDQMVTSITRVGVNPAPKGTSAA